MQQTSINLSLTYPVICRVMETKASDDSVLKVFQESQQPNGKEQE